MLVQPNHLALSRVGIRCQRGLKPAVTRNRIRRRIRSIIFSSEFALRQGVDVIIVGKPAASGAPFPLLKQEMEKLAVS